MRRRIPSPVFQRRLKRAKVSSGPSIGGFSTIRRLPLKILLQNFEECVENEIDELHRQMLFTAPSLPRMPITLAAVCRTWRWMVLRSPRLWSYIRLPLYELITDRWGNDSWTHTGSDFSINFATRARGVAIELTLPGHNPTIAGELTKMNDHRLNLPMSVAHGLLQVTYLLLRIFGWWIRVQHTLRAQSRQLPSLAPHPSLALMSIQSLKPLPNL